MTEIAGLGTTHAVYAPPVPGSIGVALPGIEVRVADLEDVVRDAPSGIPGELMVRGPIVMMGYFGNPEETASTIEPDGGLHTGDIAYADQTGHFFVVDRRRDLIITAGYNVYPAEIERVLSGHPAVAMVAVGPVKDEIKGELACAQRRPERLSRYLSHRCPERPPLAATSIVPVVTQRLARLITNHAGFHGCDAMKERASAPGGCWKLQSIRLHQAREARNDGSI